MGFLCSGGIAGSSRVGISIEVSSVVGNTAATSAGGIYIETDSTLRVTNTTVAGNLVVAGSGGVRKKSL